MLFNFFAPQGAQIAELLIALGPNPEREFFGQIIQTDHLQLIYIIVSELPVFPGHV